MANFQDPTAEPRHARNVVAAAKDAGTVATIVVSTTVKTGEHVAWAAKDPNYVLADYYAPSHAVEEVVRGAGLKHYTVLRPVWLMHNFLPPEAGRIFPEIKEGRMGFASSPETQMPHISAEDVGKFAAAALTEPERFSGHEIELGVGGMTVSGVVKTLSEVSGVQLEAKYYSPEEAFGLLEKMPTLAFDLWAKEEPYEIDNRDLEKYGIPLTPLSVFLEKNKGLLMQALGKDG